MTICDELTGKVIHSLKVYESSIDGSEVSIEFTDGTFFTARFVMASTIEAKINRNEEGNFQLLKSYTTTSSSKS